MSLLLPSKFCVGDVSHNRMFRNHDKQRNRQESNGIGYESCWYYEPTFHKNLGYLKSF